MSEIVTVKEHVVEFPVASVTLKVFVVVPTVNAAPLASPAVWLVVALGQLSLPTGAVNVTTLEHWPTSLLPVIFAGQAIAGAWLSEIVTVKEHVVELPDASVTLNVFVVVPTGKAAPLARPAV